MMNKQKVTEKIEKLEGLTVKDKDFNLDIEMIPKGDVLEIIEQIDEPEKPVVPQFVANWYEENKNDFEYNLAHLINDYFKGEIEDDNLMSWFDYDFNFDRNKPIQTLINMHKIGYEVEKEKLYTVKFANEDFGKMYIGIFKKFNKLGISSLPLNDDEVKSWFTKDELKRFKFWDNPAFEVKEVKK